LEPIRQFAEEQLAAIGTIGDVRDRHSDRFATQAIVHHEMWEGARQREALDWFDVEFANLRAGFRWATDQDNLKTALAIAAHTAFGGWLLQRYEPVGWVEELLPAATAADLAQLPRLYTAAGLCAYLGRPEEAVVYTQTAIELEADPRYQPFEYGSSQGLKANAHIFAGRIDRFVDINTALAAKTGIAHVLGLCGLTYALPALGRAREARAIADECLAAARAHGNPFYVAYALTGYGRAFAATEPVRALDAYREGLAYTKQHRLLLLDAVIAREAAELEAVHGSLEQGLALFDTTIDSFHQSGEIGQLAATFAHLAMFLDRYEQPDIAATIYAATIRYPYTAIVVGLDATVDHLRSVLSQTRFDECVAAGAAMELSEAVQYARHHIQLTRRQLDDQS
jgi:tetratricopeptide (TPR) repeat protein